MFIQNYYENPDITSVNTEPMRSYYIPFSTKMGVNWKDRNQTDRFFSLNGDWKFQYYDNIYQCTDKFYEEKFLPRGFDSIPVPSNWQMHGYDQIQYTNTQYPFPFDPPYVPVNNPCGVYIRKFLFACSEEREEYLNFEGVDSCCYVWINGSFVGYHQVSHSTNEYRVTEYLKSGENTIAVLVLKWCDGSYLEDQDKFRTSGIFRDVYILSRPKSFIWDYRVNTILSSDYRSAVLKVDLDIHGDDLKVTGCLINPKGEIVNRKICKNDALIFGVENVELWNAERPALYQLLLITEDEIIRENVGFRNIEIKKSVVYLNGNKIRFRGVNRHDSDPIVGSAVRREHIIKDLQLMKQHNFNAIRTSHYPNSPELYELCDQYGFYVIDEADLEAHGVIDLYDLNIFEDPLEHTFPTFICDNPQWTNAVVNRVKHLVIRDKNRPCVLIWSMGNESGYGVTFETALKWVKDYDNTRLTHYEGSLHRPKNRDNDYSYIDLRSRMYASIPEMHAYLSKKPDKPFIQCEYIHAMGNGPGDIEDYYKLEEQYDSYVGGFVWEWADSAVEKKDTTVHKRQYLYGGDHGEFPHFGNFCVDGLTTPDRKITSGLREYKNVHRPARIEAVIPGKKRYSIRNNLDFTNLKDYLYLKFKILVDGEDYDEGVIDNPEILDVPPRSTKIVELPIKIPRQSGKISVIIWEYLKVNIDFRHSGDELGFNEIILTDDRSKTVEKFLEEIEFPRGKLKVKEDEQYVTIIGKLFEYKYNKLTAAFDELIIDERNMIEKPMSLSVWRAPTDNDRIVKKMWYAAGYDMLITKTYSSIVSTSTSGDVIILTKASMAPVYRQRVLDYSVCWTVKKDGTILADFDVERNPVINGKYGEFFNHPEDQYDKHGILNMYNLNDAYLPRLGLRLFLSKKMNQVEYLGYGPYESYVDKHQASYCGLFKQKVSDMFVDYIRPQENGSHYGCDYISITDNVYRLFVCSDKPMCFNASEYTAEELTKKAHSFELEKSGYTVLCLDHVQSGIGSGSCGPQLDFQYRVNSQKYKFCFYLKFY